MSKYDQGIYSPYLENIYKPEQATQLILKRLQRSSGRPRIGIDLDGVLFTGYGDQPDKVIHQNARDTLIGLNRSFDLSLITSRNTKVLSTIQHLTDGQVDLRGGLHSFEKGALQYDGSRSEPIVPLTSNSYMQFLSEIDRKLFKGKDSYGNIVESSWSDVLRGYDDWCWGDSTWYGETGRSIWYRYGDISTQKFIETTIKAAAEKMETDEFDFAHLKQPEKKLAWTKVYPLGISKADPFLTFPHTEISLYISDGAHGEKETIMRFKESFEPDMRPLSIVIGESPDACDSEMNWCRQNADICIPTVDQTYMVLQSVLQMTEQSS